MRISELNATDFESIDKLVELERARRSQAQSPSKQQMLQGSSLEWTRPQQTAELNVDWELASEKGLISEGNAPRKIHL